MCGITGIYAFNQIGSLYMINLVKATEKLSKRGPDWQGTFVDDYVGLGHRRLSILDTSGRGNQPMKDDSGRYVIVYNGEIFNFKELRKELQEAGFEFNSDTDTEVILKLYIHFGKSFLSRLVGFFAFAIYDKETKEIFLARDRMGIKPLLVYYDDDKFIFASEMKSLMAYNIPKNIDFASMMQYLQLTYIPAPSTIFENVVKLLPGHCVTVGKKKVEVERYYQVKANERFDGDYEKAKQRLVELMDESVKMRLMSDVPIGAFLSGGIDSSIIVGLASSYTKNLNTFSIGYRDYPLYDETKYAKFVAEKFNTNHTVFSLSESDISEQIYSVLENLDEPFADSSVIPLYYLCNKTSKKAKVALSGDGGDELFGGYNKHMAEYKMYHGSFQISLLNILSPIISNLSPSRSTAFGNKIRQLQKFTRAFGCSPKDRYWNWACLNPEGQSLLEKNIISTGTNTFQKRKGELLRTVSNGGLNETLLSDINLVLPNDMLHKVDAMSMANGLEVRVPFLDHRVVEFAFSLPEEYKLNGKMKKRIVQDAFRELLPEQLYNRPKQGFEVPLTDIFRREFKNQICNEWLADDLIEEQGIFNRNKISQLKNQLKSGQFLEQGVIWQLIVFQYWYKKYLNF
ncbi:MAG: asparagine synthase (glutamine-hydrolyzing) [Cytophagaceae bacterium]